MGGHRTAARRGSWRAGGRREQDLLALCAGFRRHAVTATSRKGVCSPQEVPLRNVLTSAAARPMWTWARTLLGVGILAWLGWRLGSGPFLEGVGAIDRSSLVVATVIGAVTTACCAWRWRLVAGSLGVRLPMVEAFAACYRSQFLNMTLPFGVVGDVHRAV